jgi:hypothetical protein
MADFLKALEEKKPDMEERSFASLATPQKLILQ